MAVTAIEWTDATWNPIVGCSVISPGCTNCYAMKLAARLARISAARSGGNARQSSPHAHYRGLTEDSRGGPVWNGRVARGGTLLDPLKRKKPTRYFVNSMGDLFHEAALAAWIDQVLAVMGLAPQHQFQILTKRPERMRGYLTDPAAGERINQEAQRFLGHLIGRYCNGLYVASWRNQGLPLANVWLGVSTEDQRRAGERVPVLLETPAALRFISAEPLLGGIDLPGLTALD